ncbi:RsiV family protein [Acinetobacter sp.]|uniref:RsiV family protein n=1 Tax=Acinetobacter sp. TaxID=472 RepID=UPI002648B15E|nr:RsiV family protein [Acinetobacter sp.]MDN5512278.1 RsiV family protein [Acinetobacter sp.]MDN5524593.1 RsiV family protein [Acinetobacter sp.]
MLKNKTIFTLSLVAAAIALSACQPKQPEPKKEDKLAQSQAAQAEALTLTGDTEKLTLNLPECDGNSCPEISIERLSTNQTFIDEFIDQQILKQLDHTVDISPKSLNANQHATTASGNSKDSNPAQADEPAASAAIETPKQKLEKQLVPYLQTFLSLDKELKALSANHQISLMIKPKILNAGQPLATVVLNSNSYLGGAHGSSSQYYYNFDLKKKKLVKLDDILAPNQKAVLEQKAHEVFKSWVINSKLANSVDEYEQAWKFTLSDNFYLSTQGLILQYGEYEIGPYVVGLPRLTIPYDQLQTVLKKAYLPQAEVKNKAAAVSAASDTKAQS